MYFDIDYIPSYKYRRAAEILLGTSHLIFKCRYSMRIWKSLEGTGMPELVFQDWSNFDNVKDWWEHLTLYYIQMVIGRQPSPPTLCSRVRNLE
jgi:hypothetical protein